MKIIGGQALLGGIALRSNRGRVAVVRRANGRLTIGVGAPAHAFEHIPILRGISLWFLLTPTENEWAAKKIEADLDGEREEMPRAEPLDYRGELLDAQREALPPHRRTNLPRVVFVTAIVFFLFSIATDGLVRLFGLGSAPATPAFQGFTTVVIVVAYLLYFLAVARWLPDLKQVYRYGGALKQSLWAAAEGEATPEAVERQPTWHFRSSGIAMVLGAIVMGGAAAGVFDLAPSLGSTNSWFLSHAIVAGVRVALLPLVLGFVEELQRILTLLGKGPLVRVVFAPLLVFERLHTAPPQREEIDVAVAAARELAKLDADPPA